MELKVGVRAAAVAIAVVAIDVLETLPPTLVTVMTTLMKLPASVAAAV